MGSVSVRHPCIKCLRLSSRGCFHRRHSAYSTLFHRCSRIKIERNDIARIIRSLLEWQNHYKQEEHCFPTPTAHTAVSTASHLNGDLTMQGEIAMVAPISPEHKRKVAKTLPRVSLPSGISTWTSIAPCSSDTWDSEQVWVKLVLYLYN